jgi:lipopolysaccharide export system protein LptA
MTGSGVVSAFRVLLLSALMATPACLSQSQAAPPASKGPPNAVQGFSTNKDQPIHIEALRLEVRDKDKLATFSGDVQVVQGDTQLRCKTLVVFYEQEADKPAAGSTNVSLGSPGNGGEQRIRKLEARGGVVVTQNDQIATGDHALFDMKTNSVTLIGNVVVTQGQNVLRGDRLYVDLTTGVSRVESGKTGKAGEGRVQGLFLPGSGPVGAPPAGPKGVLEGRQPAPPRPAPGQPMRLN